MALRKSVVALLLVSSCCIVLVPGCRTQQKPKAVHVRLFRDLNAPNAPQLDLRILEFQATNPHILSGTPIMVQSFPDQDYEVALKDRLGKDVNPDVVILDSPQDGATNPAISADLGRAVNVCGAFKRCPDNVPAYIPAKVAGPEAEAAKVFLDFLQQQH